MSMGTVAISAILGDSGDSLKVLEWPVEDHLWDDLYSAPTDLKHCSKGPRQSLHPWVR